jgi:hypothetical protein
MKFNIYKVNNIFKRSKVEDKTFQTVLMSAKDSYRLKMMEATRNVLTCEELSKVHQENVNAVITQSTPLLNVSEKMKDELGKTLQKVIHLKNYIKDL